MSSGVQVQGDVGGMGCRKPGVWGYVVVGRFYFSGKTTFNFVCNLTRTYVCMHVYSE